MVITRNIGLVSSVGRAPDLQAGVAVASCIGHTFSSLVYFTANGARRAVSRGNNSYSKVSLPLCIYAERNCNLPIHSAPVLRNTLYNIMYTI